MAIYALVDCNNFFVSCERVFRPELNGLPVVVMSNNDSIIISRSNEAKALGIQMGTPASVIRKNFPNNVVFCSSNYELYGDMSMRVMTTLRQLAPDIDVYSIDEAFLDITGMNEHVNLLEYGKMITKTVYKNTGIPVSVGIDDTKTLAKLCSHYAKKHPECKGIKYIETEDDRAIVLNWSKIGDVWGIGRHTEEFLQKNGITTAYQFSRKELEWVRQRLTMQGERTWRELNGESCINIEYNNVKKQICTSRGFGSTVTEIGTLAEAISYFSVSCGRKLRIQNSLAKSMILFFRTIDRNGIWSGFLPSKRIIFPVATDSDFEINKYAIRELQQCFKKGTQYKKAGVIITEIVSNEVVQQNLFDDVDREKHSKLMSTIDKINDRLGHSTVRMATQGYDKDWQIKRDYLSRCYSTCFEDIIEVKTD